MERQLKEMAIFFSSFFCAWFHSLIGEWNSVRACRFELRYFDPFLVLDEFTGELSQSIRPFFSLSEPSTPHLG